MRVRIRFTKDDASIVLPKSLLTRAGLQHATALQLSVEDGAIVLRRAARRVRVGWAAAAMAVAAGEDGTPTLSEFGNEGDADLCW